MRQGQAKKYAFCFGQKSIIIQKKKEDFLRLAKRTLESFGNHTSNFAVMFGGFDYTKGLKGIKVAGLKGKRRLEFEDVLI